MDVLAAFVGYFAQANRALDLKLGPDGPPNELLIPQRVAISEALSTPYTVDAVVLSGQEGLELKSLIGVAAAIGIATDHGRRHVAGIISHARRLGHDGGLVSYGLRIVPGLSLLDLDRRSRMFQGKTVPEIVTDVLNEQIQGNPVIGAAFRFESKLTRTYPVHPYCNQYRESTRAFIERLLVEEGISYTFTFDASSDTPTHTLLLFDDAYDLPVAPTASLPYHPTSADGHTLTDVLFEWQGERHVVPGSVQLASYDYDEAAPRHASESSAVDQGERGNRTASTLQDYDPQTHYVANAKGSDALDRRALLRQRAHELSAKTFYGAGTVSTLSTGTWFQLEHHPDHAADSAEQRQFLVVGQWVEVANNLPADLRAMVPQGLLSPATWAHVNPPTAFPPAPEGHPTFTRLAAVRRNVHVVPPDAGHAAKPSAHGLQTATVVGPAGAIVHTDAQGRIFVQPHYQRPEDHPSGGADFDEKSSCAIRVAYPHAGAGFGYQSIPRVGQEVVIDYLEGDIDRPLVVGSVYNGQHDVPAFSGVGTLPGNRVLTGIQSQEHGGSGHNELLMDDTPGQVRARVASTHGASALNLGFLTTPRQDGQATARGEGAELRTDAAAALRAAQGLLLTTYARTQAQGHQLDREELVKLMAECGELFKALGDYAAQHGSVATDASGQAALKDALAGWPDTRSPQGNGQPVIALGGEAGIASVTPQSHLAYAGQNIDNVAQQHLQLTSGQRFSAHAGAGIQLFAQADGISAIANQGKVWLQAQADDLIAEAAKTIQLTATGEVVITGQRIHLVAADGSYHTIGGGHELGSNADLTVKTANHHFQGPATQSSQPPSFDKAGTQQRYRLHFPGHSDDTPMPAAGQAYKITLNDGRVVEGTADATGLTDLMQEDVMRIAHIDLLKPGL